MDIKVMKVFCDLVDTGSFTRAAQASGISQSAVSQQVANLERQFSTQLISRSGGLVVPTDTGQAFCVGAREIIRRYEQLQGEIQSAAQAVRGVLRVGTIYSVGFYLLDPYIRRFIKSHPEVNLHVEYTRWNHIHAALLSGEMDLGVVACPERHRSIEVIPLANEPLVVVCSPEHPLATAGEIDPARLKGERFIAFEKDVPTRRHIDRLLARSRVAVNIVMEFDNIETLKRAIEVNAGLSILPQENVQREIADGRLAFAALTHSDKWFRPVGVLRRRGRVPGPAERMFLGLLRGQG